MSPIHIPHLSSALRAMELLAVRPRSAPELADGLGFHVRTAWRVLKRLESEGYVVLSDDRRRRYRPTMRVVALAGQVVERAELPSTARPHVTALREQVGGSCHLCVPSHMFAVCLVHEQGDRGCVCRPHLRELVPCHCTAAGKALLAWREGWREAVLEQPLASFTERTNVGPESVRRELALTVARGYSLEDREYEMATRGLAAPVFAETGETVAALAVVGRVEELPADRHAEIGAAVMTAAAACRASSGTRPPWPRRGQTTGRPFPCTVCAGP
jgi:DNA-binding IclR family transcriptional regulator